MASLFGADIPVSMPSFGMGNIWVWLLMFLILIIIIGGAIGTFLIHRYRTYNRKIIVFENLAGQGYQPVFKDRARLIKLGDQGEEVLYLLKKKVYRSAYGKKMGKNTYWFAIGQDGYWYNVILGDVDAKMGMLDIEPIDRDMRYMHVAIRKNIQDRYRKISVMEKYGTYIMSGIFLIIMIIGIWFLLDKIADIAVVTADNVEANKAVAEASERIISSLDNICSGSGIN